MFIYKPYIYHLLYYVNHYFLPLLNYVNVQLLLFCVVIIELTQLLPLCGSLFYTSMCVDICSNYDFDIRLTFALW